MCVRACVCGYCVLHVDKKDEEREGVLCAWACWGPGSKRHDSVEIT